jgi:AmiR/NasT family two-component response regulator
MARNPRVVVIGPEPVSRDEIQKMLALSGFAVLGEAGYGIEAVSLAKKTEPDVVVIAIEEPSFALFKRWRRWQTSCLSHPSSATHQSKTPVPCAGRCKPG